jgi:RNA polymerase sigma-70 factor, ECF subfamily
LLESSMAAGSSSGAALDKELGRALVEGHPDALTRAFRRYHSMVHSILRRGLGPQADVEDVVQDVFLALFRSARGLRDANAVRPFVVGIALHMLRQEQRRRKRRSRTSELRFTALTAVGDGPATSYAVIKLKRLLHRLSEQERASLLLRFGHGMTVTEVAEALQVSEPTAKRRLSRARESLGAWAARDEFLFSYLRGAKVSLTAGMDC